MKPGKKRNKPAQKRYVAENRCARNKARRAEKEALRQLKFKERALAKKKAINSVQ